MDNLTKTFKSLLKFSGKALFVIGLVLNICMICFGFWPSFIYILIMLVGASLVALNNDTEQEQLVDTDAGWLTKSYNTIAIYFKKNGRQSIEKIIKNVFIILLAIVVLFISAFVLSQDYLRKRDTINNCKNIVAALNHYKKGKNSYPINLSEVIDQNPLLSKADQWGNSYQYQAKENGNHFILVSAGQDKKFNTSDDLIFKN